MDRLLTSFIRALRNADVRISTAETLDAFSTVQLVGYGDRRLLKESLALVLPKTQLREGGIRYLLRPVLLDARPRAAAARSRE